jgi:hypothetical protein
MRRGRVIEPLYERFWVLGGWSANRTLLSSA